MKLQELKALRPGNTVYHKRDRGITYVVTGNYGNHVTAVRTVDMTNPDEWEVADPYDCGPLETLRTLEEAGIDIVDLKENLTAQFHQQESRYGRAGMSTDHKDRAELVVTILLDCARMAAQRKAEKS